MGEKVLSNEQLKKFLTGRMRREVYDEVHPEGEARGAAEG